jgi:hypothetical protein
MLMLAASRGPGTHHAERYGVALKLCAPGAPGKTTREEPGAGVAVAVGVALAVAVAVASAVADADALADAVAVADADWVADADAVMLSGPPAKRSTSPVVALRPATRKGETDPDGTDAPVGP